MLTRLLHFLRAFSDSINFVVNSIRRSFAANVTGSIIFPSRQHMEHVNPRSLLGLISFPHRRKHMLQPSRRSATPTSMTPTSSHSSSLQTSMALSALGSAKAQSLCTRPSGDIEDTGNSLNDLGTACAFCELEMYARPKQEGRAHGESERNGHARLAVYVCVCVMLTAHCCVHA